MNRMKIESEVTCLTYTTAPEGVYVNVIATGMRDGNVRCVCVMLNVRIHTRVRTRIHTHKTMAKPTLGYLLTT